MINLALEELELLLESLQYTRRSFENYNGYPSYEFKLARIKEVSDLMTKLRAEKREAKKQCQNFTN